MVNRASADIGMAGATDDEHQLNNNNNETIPGDAERPDRDEDDEASTASAETESVGSFPSQRGHGTYGDGKDPTKIQATGYDQLEIQNTRTNMTIFHFIMKAPKWSFTLFLFLASCTSRPLPVFKAAVRDPIERLHTLVRLEGRSYENCIEQSTTRSQRSLRDIAIQDRAALDQLHAKNDRILAQAKKASSTCLARTQKARDSLARWRDDGAELPWAEVTNISDASAVSTCTVERRNQTEALLGRDYGLAEDQVSDAFDNYLHDSQHSLALVHSYAVERFDYDLNYFIVERIQPALDYLANQTLDIDGMVVTFSVDLTEVERKMRQTLEELEAVLARAKQHIDLLEKKVRELVASIMAFYKAYGLAFNRLVMGADFVIDLLPPGAKLPSFFDLSTLPSAEIFLPTTSLSLPEFNLELDKIHLMLDDVAADCLRIMLKALDDVRRQATQQLRGAAREVTQFLLELLELEDYRPPRFQGSREGIGSMQGEMDFQALRGQETLTLALETMAKIRVQATELEIEGNIQGPNVTFRNYSFVEDTTQFEYLGVRFPDLSLPDFLMTLLVWLAANTWFVEVVIHTYRLRKLEAVYARGAIPNLPKIDFAEGDTVAEQPQTQYMLLGLLLKSLMSPRNLLFVFVFLPFAIVLMVFWFPHVHNSCVITSDGTVLANYFLAPMMVNRGNTLGNAKYLHAEFSCQQSQIAWCTSVGAEAETRYRSDWTTLSSFQVEHNHSLDALSLLDTCINLTDMSTMVKESCCGLKGYGSGSDCSNATNLTCPIDSSTSPPSAFRPMDTYLNEPACHESLHEWVLHDSQYDCSNLDEACRHIPCNGVNADLIRAHTISTDCQVELYAIDFLYFLLAVFLHAIAINIICTLIFLGYREVIWRQLDPYGIRLLTNMSENGELVKGFEIEERSNRISRELRYYEMKGKIKLWLGVALLIVYAITTLVFSLIK